MLKISLSVYFQVKECSQPLKGSSNEVELKLLESVYIAGVILKLNSNTDKLVI
jgi:hypothetical protein